MTDDIALPPDPPEPPVSTPFLDRDDGETDAEWRLRMHEDPSCPFLLGPESLAEVKLAVANGDEEAVSRNYTPDELLRLHEDENHPLELPADQLAQLRGEAPPEDEVTQLRREVAELRELVLEKQKRR